MMMADKQGSARPLPATTLTTAPFWAAAKEKKLLLQYDSQAGEYQFTPRPVSIHTGRADLEWRQASGKGKLFAHTVCYVPAKGFEDLAPYVLAAVDLDEGVRVVARLVDVAPDEVEPGMKLRVCWDELSDDINYFAFERDG
jgi:uncharacterized OB-fold protein